MVHREDMNHAQVYVVSLTGVQEMTEEGKFDSERRREPSTIGLCCSTIEADLIILIAVAESCIVILMSLTLLASPIYIDRASDILCSLRRKDITSSSSLVFSICSTLDSSYSNSEQYASVLFIFNLSNSTILVECSRFSLASRSSPASRLLCNSLSIIAFSFSPPTPQYCGFTGYRFPLLPLDCIVLQSAGDTSVEGGATRVGGRDSGLCVIANFPRPSPVTLSSGLVR